MKSSFPFAHAVSSTRVMAAAILVAVVTVTAWAPVAGGGSGPSMVEDIKPTSGSNPQELTNAGGILYFSANDGVKGRELWRSDGTMLGTRRVKDIRPGSGGSAPRGLTNVAGKLFFGANDGVHGRELWVSNGTAAGTQRLTDINPGSADSSPFQLTAVGGVLFFSVTHAGTDRFELWKSDGTPAGTVRVKRFAPGQFSVGAPAAFEGRLFFTLLHGTLATEGLGLWTSDGTGPGTEHFFGPPGSWPESITPVGPRLFWNDNGVLRRTNGTPGTTKSMGDVEPGLWLTGVGTTLFFPGFVDDEMDETDGLWKSDGSVATTVLVKQLSNPVFLTRVGSQLFFRNSLLSEPEISLWVSNGTSGGTESLLEVPTGTRLDELTNVGGTLYLIVDEALWRSDGTVGGTEHVADVDAAQALTHAGGTLYFTADDGTNGRELWKYVP